MAVTKVVMPKLSEAMESGKIIKWLKKEGDRIQGGDILAEVETDKADVEMEAFGAGVLRKILVPAGETAPIGALIGVIADPGDDIAALVASAPGGAGAGPAPPRRRGRRLERRAGGGARRRIGRRIRGRSAHPDPGGDRPADAAVEGAGPALLRHERGRDGPRVGAARGAERAGGPAQDLRERPRDPGLRADAREASGRERLAAGRRGPRLPSSAHRHRRRARGRAHHARPA